jgi:flavin-dependent dehydrogenase
MITTILAELPITDETIWERFRDNIVVFLYPSERIRYIVVIPKKNYITVSIINIADANHDDLTRFLNSEIFAPYLSQNEPLVPRFCSCHPRIAISSSRRPFANRMVLIGDLSYTRIYKNGIESAYYTAQCAANTALKRGVSEKIFRRYYNLSMKKFFVLDNIFGRLMFFINDYIVKHHFFFRGFLRALSHSTKTRMNRHLRSVVWNMFTGRERYYKIFFQFINPMCQLFIASNTLENFWKEISLKSIRKSPFSSMNFQIIRAKAKMKGLQDGAVVGIIGGGPGGISCAIALKNLAQERGINIRTVIYEGKTYSGVPHYNQCVGVLSPPIRSLMEEQLNIPFPKHLIQRMITGYILHTDNDQVKLPDESEFSLAVRRITFDHYMLEQAVEREVEFRQSRVTDIEFHKDGVILYSESDNLRADVIIGAFGLDDGSIQIFERVTKYQAPEFLTSIVTKIHPDQKYLDRIGNNIIAFLPSFRQIEFGAITPKKNHITINIAGKKIDANCMDTFLSYQPVRKILPKNGEFNRKSLYYFKGKFPISIAKNFYGNRYVMIGDAAGLVRPFKGKGVNSAIQTGIYAARVIMHEGISHHAFKQYEELCHTIIRDLPYGKLIRRFTIFSANHGLLDFLIHFSQQNQNVRRALFNSVSAHKLYREILRETVNWSLPKDVFQAFFKYQRAKFHHSGKR